MLSVRGEFLSLFFSFSDFLFGSTVILFYISFLVVLVFSERSPEDEKLYANYAPHFNFGPIERGEKQTNNID